MDIGVVIYGDLDATSGGFRYDRQLVSSLRAAGDTVTICSLPWRSYPRGLLDAAVPAVRSLLDREFDVLLQDELCHPSLWWHNRRLTEPAAVVGLVHHLRSDDPTERYRSLMRPVERRYLDSADATIHTSAFTRRRAAAMAPSTADRPSLVAPPSGRAESAALDAATVAARASDGPLRIVFVGSLVPRKAPRTLLTAVASGDNWELTVVGSHDANPDYAARVVADADRLGIADRVEFTGEVDDDDLEAILADHHVCCVPSHYEAFGMSYLEAMEYGVVPIAGQAGGAGEFISHGRNGYLVAPDGPEKIATVLSRLDSDRALLSGLGRAALATADAYPPWNETMAELRSFLVSVVDDVD